MTCKKMKKGLTLFLVTAASVLAVSRQSWGASAISSVSLDVESDLHIGDDYSTDDIEVTARKGHFSVGDIELLNENDWWEEDEIPRISVMLNADEGYYFSISRSNIKVKGATYISGRKEDSYTLVVTLELPSMLETLGETGQARWTSVNEAEWDPVPNAGHYEVRLYREGKTIGGLQKATEPKIDFGSLMRKEGTYNFRVRAVNKRNNDVKSEWLDSGATSYIDEETAARFRSQYGETIPDYITEPSQMNQIYYTPDQYGWIRDNVGWWYCNPDKTYTTSNWQLIDGKWYYFNSSGYMVTGWIDWKGKSYYCDPVNGDMQVNKLIDDGSGRRVDSTGAWIQ